MSTKTERGPQVEPQAAGSVKPPTKKDQIISLFQSGIDEIIDIAAITRARTSYVASVLQQAGLMKGYFDLYTSTGQPMNAYSKFFANRLGFKDEETARASVETIDRQFERAGDRAGQHHALMMALTMFDRARWTNKGPEAEVFGRWITDQLQRANVGQAGPAVPSKAGAKSEETSGVVKVP
jgi:hypothetical protein